MPEFPEYYVGDLPGDEEAAGAGIGLIDEVLDGFL